MNLDSLQENTTPEAAKGNWQAPTNLDNLDGKNWGGEVEPSRLAIQSSFDTLRSVPGVMNEGRKAGTDAANTLFAQNTSGISSALKAKANRTFSRGQQRQDLNQQLQGYERSRQVLGQSLAEQQNLWKLKKANFVGQLQWADKVANYNQAMETTKLGLLGSIISGGMAVAGMAIAGPAEGLS